MGSTIATTATGESNGSSGVYVYCIIECGEPRRIWSYMANGSRRRSSEKRFIALPKSSAEFGPETRKARRVGPDRARFTYSRHGAAAKSPSAIGWPNTPTTPAGHMGWS